MNAGYLALALGISVAITVGLRALPFGAKSAMKDSALLADIGRWMPLGVISILAIYCLSGIDFTAARHGIPEAAGVLVTVAVHLWRRNAVLSIITGTATCLLLTNLPIAHLP